MNFIYILTLLALYVIYGVCIFLMKYARSFTLANCIFTALVFLPYTMLCLTVYLDVGFNDWNFQNTLPVANVSPFMFSMVPIILILPKRLKKHAHLLISLLTVGMFLSSTFGCIYNALIGYKFHLHFTYDYISHFTLSLFGIYLIRTKQADLSKKNVLISSSLIYGAAAVMILLNVIFDKAFFGLSLNGKHNIYNNVLVDNSYLSALLYLIGLAFVLALGYVVSAIFNKERFKVEPSK